MSRSDKSRAIGNDHTAAGSGKLARPARKLRCVPVSKANKELEIYPLDETVVEQTFAQRLQEPMLPVIKAKHADNRHLLRLRASHKRPYCRATEKGYELPPPHSITSSDRVGRGLTLLAFSVRVHKQPSAQLLAARKAPSWRLSRP
jgi:hypothetical protein